MPLPKGERFPEHYRGEDYELAPSCLNNPSPLCVEDMPMGKPHQRQKIRSRKILPLSYEGENIKRIAQSLKVSQHTVQQVLKERYEDQDS